MKETEPLFKKVRLVKCHSLKASSDEDMKMREQRCRRALCSPADRDLVARVQCQPTVEFTQQRSNVKSQQMTKGAHNEQNKTALGLAAKAVERTAHLLWSGKQWSKPSELKRSREDS